MSIYKFQHQTYLNYKDNWFVWEACWDSWKPVKSLYWNGTQFVLIELDTDPTSELYGFGSPQMKQVCEVLSETYSPEKASDVSFLSFGNTEWWRDRMVTVPSCADKSVDSWKRMCRGKPRTCRKAPKGKKLTRRQA